MLKAACHTEGSGWQEIDDLSSLSELRNEPGNLLWLEADVIDLRPDVVELVADEFGLHPLAVEDALQTRQRPKWEPYEGHMFAVMHQLDEIDGQLESRQIACFIGSGFVITIHESASRSIEEAKTRWKKVDTWGRRGPAILIHTLIDAVVDDYEATATRLEAEVESLEDVALGHTAAIDQRQLYSLKQRLARLRRYVIPSQRVLDGVVDHSRHQLFSQETATLFRDIDDHLQRIADQLRNIDDLAQAVLDLQRSEQANSLNEVTKLLTGWAAIIAVPTFIASVYGMNFELIPDEGSMVGFIFAVGSMVVAGVSLFLLFRHRKWL